MYNTGNKAVDFLGTVHLEGNIMPPLWFKHITFEKGKPDLVGIIILSEIVYWHRPTVLRDEHTGQIVTVKKKFKADLLQRSYDSFAEQFGFSKRQAREAMIRLEELHLLKRVFRTIPSNNGPLSNVLFIELNAEAVKHITHTDVPYDVSMSHLWHPNVTPPTLKSHTYTEITTENTTTAAQPVITLPMYFQQELFVPLSPIQMQQLFDWSDDYGEDLVKFAIDRCAAINYRNFNSVVKFLREWINNGAKTLEAAQAYEKDKFAKKQGQAAGKPGFNWDDFK